jgi:putative peptide zinc metalloprotease protein
VRVWSGRPSPPPSTEEAVITVVEEGTREGAVASAEAEADGHDRPALAEGIELIGEMEGSGFKEPPSLVRRADGQVIQLTPLLYAVAARSDGQHTLDEIAEEVGAEIGRGVSADNVHVLVDKKLRPLGVLAEADGSSPQARKADPMLALRFRAAVIPEALSNRLAGVFRPLFFGPIVLAALVGLVVADVWLFAGHGVAQSIREGLYHPGLFLPLFGAVVLSAALHEIGHAAACRYGGGTPGKMGCGIYLAWPAFYTDVTDAYRLGKKGRLRTDLGGVYFNVLVILATYGISFATRNEAVLILVVVQHFEIVHQLLPVVRLDGYYIVADLTGVPDLFARIKPILQSLLPWKRADERVTVLKRWVRLAVTVWVLIVVPLLVFQLLMVLMHLPRIVGTALDSGGKQLAAISGAFGDGNVLGVLSGVLQLVALAIPVIGILLMLASVARRLATTAWTRTEERPVARTLVCVAGAAFVALLLLAWVPKGNYRPIQPGERGTLTEGIAAVRRLPTGDGPLESRRAAEAAGRLEATDGDADADEPATAPATADDVDGSTSPTTSTTVEDPAPTTTERAVTTTAARSTSATTARTTATTSASTTTSTTEPETTTTSTTDTTAP